MSFKLNKKYRVSKVSPHKVSTVRGKGCFDQLTEESLDIWLLFPCAEVAFNRVIGTMKIVSLGRIHTTMNLLLCILSDYQHHGQSKKMSLKSVKLDAMEIPMKSLVDDDVAQNSICWDRKLLTQSLNDELGLSSFLQVGRFSPILF